MSAESSYSESRDTSRPTNVRWLVFMLGAGTSWILYVHRYAFGMMKPFLIEEAGLTKDELGWVDAVFQTSYSIFQLPIALLADLWSPRILLSVMIVAWSLLLAMQAAFPDFRILVIIRGAFGAAQAGTFAALTPLTRHWFPLSVRTRVQGLIGTSAGRLGGLSVNFLFATVLVASLGLRWEQAVYAFAAIGVALGIAFFVLVRDRPRQHPLINRAEIDLIEAGTPDVESERERERTGQRRVSLVEFFSRLPARSSINVSMLSLAAASSAIADLVYSAWIPTYLREVHHLDYAAMGIFASLPLLGGALGGAYGGFLNDWLLTATGGRRRLARSLVGSGGKGLAGVTLAVSLFFADRPYVFCGMLFVVKFFADWELASRWGCATDIGRGLSATVSGFVNTVAQAGAVGGAVMYGRVSEHFGWTPVFLIAIGFYALCATAYLFVNAAMPLLDDGQKTGN